MEAKHTPGPWRTGGANRLMVYANGWAVADAKIFHPHTDADQAEANAALIAAAPDLLAACKAALDLLTTLGKHDATTGDALEAAIARAEGRNA